jgi:hypothetical protein
MNKKIDSTNSEILTLGVSWYISKKDCEESSIWFDDNIKVTQSFNAKLSSGAL